MRNIVQTRGLGYRYPGAEAPAIEALDFEIRPGEIFGFLGPNGSGKSTTQRVLTRILREFQGDVDVFESPLRAAANDYFNDIGVFFEFPNLYEKLTAEENLSFYASFFDRPTRDSRALLEQMDLPRDDRRPVSQYSKGMKMRLVLARSLVNEPRLWFLDEPTTGQDPHHAVAIRRLIRERAEAGTTVFLTTHNMSVADELCDRVALLVEGRIRVIDSPRELKLAHSRRLVRVDYLDPNGERQRRDFDLEQESDRESLADLIRRSPIETMHTMEPSLEQVFLKLTGQRLDAPE